MHLQVVRDLWVNASWAVETILGTAQIVLETFVGKAYRVVETVGPHCHCVSRYFHRLGENEKSTRKSF
jgi:hypothetical protein